MADHHAQKDISCGLRTTTNGFCCIQAEPCSSTGYSVGVDKWDPWFARSVQYATRTLLVEVSASNAAGPEGLGDGTAHIGGARDDD